MAEDDEDSPLRGGDYSGTVQQRARWPWVLLGLFIGLLAVLFTSSSDLAHYLDQGTLSPEPGYVAWLFCVGFVSALTGRVLAMTLVARLAHPSLLAFVLAASLFVALALLGVQMSSSPIDWAFGDLCS